MLPLSAGSGLDQCRGRSAKAERPQPAFTAAGMRANGYCKGEVPITVRGDTELKTLFLYEIIVEEWLNEVSIISREF